MDCKTVHYFLEKLPKIILSSKQLDSFLDNQYYSKAIKLVRKLVTEYESNTKSTWKNLLLEEKEAEENLLKFVNTGDNLREFCTLIGRLNNISDHKCKYAASDPCKSEVECMKRLCSELRFNFCPSCYLEYRNFDKGICYCFKCKVKYVITIDEREPMTKLMDELKK